MQKTNFYKSKVDSKMQDINEFYHYFDSDKFVPLEQEEIDNITNLMYFHLKNEQEKLRKNIIVTQNYENFIKKNAIEFADKFHETRKENIHLKNESEKIK